ncbi:MAG: O-antigen ligase family protein, partial [Bacteroidota bacterium]
AYNIFPDSFQRLQSITNISLTDIDKTSKESTTVRILIWQQAMELSLQKPIFGLGVGDANDQLYQAYANNGLSGALQYHLNAHNQYLQTLLGMGLFGLLLMFHFTWMQLFSALRSKRFILFVFAFLISFNFLVESMLQTAAGVLFFCFFYCFLHNVTEKNLSNA